MPKGDDLLTYIGIDPGAKGGLAVIRDGGITVAPYEKSRYIEILSRVPCDSVCCLEHVHAMPGQGVTSMFNFGQNFGWVQGVLEAMGVSYELVQPQKWKKEFSITGDKNSSIMVCKRLFPGVSLLPTERCRKDNDGMAEALLMAEYAKRRL